MVEACKEGLLTQTLSNVAAALASWQLGQSILLFIKDHRSIIKVDWGPAWQMPCYQQLLKLSLPQTSRSLLQQNLSRTLEGLITLREVDLFAQSTYKHAVLSTTSNIYSRLSLRALGREFRSLLVTDSSSLISGTGKAKTPYRHPQSRIIPGQIAQPIWLSCFPPARCKSCSSRHADPALLSLPRQWGEGVLPHASPVQSCASTARRAGRVQGSRGSFPPAAPHITPVSF